MENKVHDARAVANEVLRLAHSEYNQITNLRVQKLLYFSHGFMLGTHKDPLFFQPIIAWKHGPVVLDVYHALRPNGAHPIKDQIQMPGLELVGDNSRAAIRYTYELLGSFSTSRLVAISHEVNGPWYKIWNNAMGENPVIPNKLIQEYFSSML